MKIHLRTAEKADLESINRIIEAAMMTWKLPERVKHLSLASYRYTDMDFEHLYLVVAVDESGDIIGVAAWEQASPKDIPHGKTALLLHGIYVDPSCHQHGVGRQLFHAAEEAAVRDHFDGLLVKAQRDAVDFFKAQGMQKLVVENTEQNYANRFWKSVDR